MSQHQFFATCPRGLEALLVEELTNCGAKTIQSTDGGVSFSGDMPMVYRANLESRIATRILWRVGQGKYATDEDLYQAAMKLNWPQWFNVGSDFMVKVTGVKCPLKSLEFATLRIKDADCDRFREAVNSRPYIDTKEPDVRIHAYLAAEDYKFYLDTSGAALYQRGLRRASIEAPLRENLAAGILKLSGWKPGTPLLDPIYGSDSDLRAVRVSKQNLEEAGLLEAVQLSKVDFTEVVPPHGEGVLVANPPYGIRIGEDEELAALYPKMGEALKRKFSGWNAYFLTTDMRLPKLMRLAPTKRTPLFNGPLECRLFEIKMVAGSNRPDAKRKTQDG